MKQLFTLLLNICLCICLCLFSLPVNQLASVIYVYVWMLKKIVSTKLCVIINSLYLNKDLTF